MVFQQKKNHEMQENHETYHKNLENHVSRQFNITRNQFFVSFFVTQKEISKSQLFIVRLIYKYF